MANSRKQQQVYFQNHSVVFQEFFNTASKEVGISNDDLDTFKFIGIRPLDGIPRHLSKVLTIGYLYKFYNNYIFEESLNQVEVKKKFEGLYPRIEGPDISLSALVGKNGSGKSSLTELLYMSIYNISVVKSLIKGDVLSELKIELFYKTDTLYRVKMNGGEISIYRYYRIKSGYENPQEIALNEFHLNRFFEEFSLWFEL